MITFDDKWKRYYASWRWLMPKHVMMPVCIRTCQCGRVIPNPTEKWTMTYCPGCHQTSLDGYDFDGYGRIGIKEGMSLPKMEIAEWHGV